MNLCGVEVFKGDIVQLNLSSPGGWIPYKYPYCLIERTNMRKGTIDVSFQGINSITIPVKGILGVKKIRHAGSNTLHLFGQTYSAKDRISIDGAVYTVLGLSDPSSGSIYVKLSRLGSTYSFPIDSLASHSVRKVFNGDFINELSPGLYGRDKILNKDGELIGLNLGYFDASSGFVSLNTAKRFVKTLNDGNIIASKDLKISELIINPPVYKKFSVNILEDDYRLGTGEYVCFGFSNRKNEENLKRLIAESYVLDKLLPKTKLGTKNAKVRGMIQESFMAYYDWNNGWFYILLNLHEMGALIRYLESAIYGRTIAIVPKPYKKPGMGIIFLNKISTYNDLNRLCE